ncbi:hypothetical protein GGI09_000400 [Coemansia sp. S100]|nr:hypothetical protein GGI09_000400 [Coemansia sp. S100]KAJ2110640.1 hypothetical protein GGI16_000208 [Coemansia sp. S142-1]
MGYLNRYLLLLAFSLLNAIAFGAIISVAAVNIADHSSPTNLIIYHAYTGLLSLALLVAEFRAPRLLNSQARFLFTYTGRGLLFTYFGCIVYTNTLYNVIACIYTVSLGVVYLIVAWVPVVPLQNGVLYNWSRWHREGSEQFYGAKEESNEEHGDDTRQRGGKSRRQYETVAATHRYSSPPGPVAESVNALGVRLSSQATAHELNPNYPAYVSAQSMVWPESPSELAISVDALTNAAAQPPGTERQNESFVYGVSVETKQSNTTGDAYLDSIVNSSRFAREVMDSENDNQVIVVRDGQSPAVVRSSFGLAGELAGNGTRPYSQCGPGSPLARPCSAARISSPMPYHVFAPESRESLNENIGHIDRALNDEYLAPESNSFHHSPR